MAGIIKAGEVERVMEMAGGRAFELGDVSRLAEAELDRARAQVAEMIATAEKRAIKIEQDAVHAGQQKATAQAVAMADKKLEKSLGPLTQAMTNAVVKLEQQRAEWQMEWEVQLVDLACAIAERIVRGELSRRPQVSHAWVKEVLEMASGETSAQLLLHPDDVAGLGVQAQQIRDTVARGLDLEIQGDPTVGRGECRLIARYGELDQRLDRQLARVMEELIGVQRPHRDVAASAAQTSELQATESSKLPTDPRPVSETSPSSGTSLSGSGLQGSGLQGSGLQGSGLDFSSLEPDGTSADGRTDSGTDWQSGRGGQ
jgi:flagellar assembly protein FliH